MKKIILPIILVIILAGIVYIGVDNLPKQDSPAIGDNGQAPERPHVLEGAGNAKIDDVPGFKPADIAAVENNLAGIGFQEAGDQS